MDPARHGARPAEPPDLLADGSYHSWPQGVGSVASIQVSRADRPNAGGRPGRAERSDLYRIRPRPRVSPRWREPFAGCSACRRGRTSTRRDGGGDVMRTRTAAATCARRGRR